MASKRAKLMVSLAQKESYQNMPIYTEDDIEIGALEKLNYVQLDCNSSTLGICSELEVPSTLPEKQETTDGCFLKVSSSIICDGFRIQPDEENKNTQVIFYQNEEFGELDETSCPVSLLENTKVAVVVAFFICWAPFHVQRLYTIYATFPKPDEKTHSLYLQIYVLVTYISGVLYYVSATTNPILYSIMSVKFREAFKETFIKCCGLGIQRGKPPKQYSILSRSKLRGDPESTDSAKDDTFQTNTSLTHKNSNDSFNGGSTRFKFSLRRVTKNSDPKDNMQKSQNSFSTYTSLPVVSSCQNKTKLNKLSQYFECLRKHPGDGKLSNENGETRLSIEFHRQGNKPHDSCDISNSSLKDVENGAIEDELGVYINELKSEGI